MYEYESYKHRLRSGDLLAWTTSGFKGLSDIPAYGIRLFTQSEYYHVGIVWVVGGRYLLVEAMPPKVRIYPISKKPNFIHIPMWNKEDMALNRTLEINEVPKMRFTKSLNEEVSGIPCLLEDEKLCAMTDEEFLLHTVGDNYSILKALVTPFMTPFYNNTWHCAYLAAKFYERRGIKNWDGYTPSEVIKGAMEYSGLGMYSVRTR